VLSAIGAGGMGEVYRARDTRLGRDVAIKVLPPSVAMDAERRARFDREAQTVAALSHPHIVAVFDTGIHDGQAFVVMELLEGETLRERLTTGALPVRKAIEYGVQVAKGLAAAHDKGLVHRDLKPDNIFVLADGHVKILDFGLARATSDGAGSGATETVAALTDPGQVMGTMGYMAPEQIRGRQVDGRADLFALGAVLYEMVTGTRAFQRETPADTMTAILKEDPPELLAVRADVPPSLDRIIRHCLEKIPAERFQSARDVAFALDALSGSASATTASGSVPAATGTTAVASSAFRERIAWGLAALALIAVGAMWWMRPAPSSAPVSRFKIPIDASSTALTINLAVAPDGHAIVVQSVWESGDRRLHLRRLDATDTVPLPGTEGGQAPFWSPDSASIGFVADGVLKRFDFSSASVRPIAPVGDVVLTAADWGRADVILLGGINGPVRSVSASGGATTPVSSLDAASGEISQTRPKFLPDGRRFVYRSRRADGSIAILLRSLDTAETRTLSTDDFFVTWTSNDQVIYRRDDVLYAQRVDWSAPALLGEATVLATEINISSVGAGRESVSDTGVLVFVQRTNRQQQFVWYGRTGNKLATVGEPSDFATFDLSNDGKRIAAARRTGSDTNLWAIDAERGTAERVTLGPTNDVDSRWSPDGLSLIFGSLRDPARSPHKVGLASDAPKLLWKFDGQIFSLDDWSRDGRWLVYHDARVPVLFARELDASGALKGEPVVAARALTGVIDQGQMSPDNRWVAYNSNDTGQHEVYVTPFPATGARVTVSRDGGAQPLWKADGRELYFLARNGMLKVSTITVNGTTLTASEPVDLFRPILPGVSVAIEQYAPHPSGTKFLMLDIVGNERTLALGVVLNWSSLVAPHPSGTSAR